ncbi:hypothetical protein L3V18_15810 [Lysobacter sp. TLK-CK17T]|uniref:Uncharacterized protein n=1 Tax=Marilutibacter chinensis TaxID=2912247 RepID=A0ABS9HWU2_9GAMM|nr:hypothetical protein [Lysobacter chinensis]
MTQRSNHPQTAAARAHDPADALHAALPPAIAAAIASALILVLVLITGPTSAGYGIA